MQDHTITLPGASKLQLRFDIGTGEIFDNYIQEHPEAVEKANANPVFHAQLVLMAAINRATSLYRLDCSLVSLEEAKNIMNCLTVDDVKDVFRRYNKALGVTPASEQPSNEGK